MAYIVVILILNVVPFLFYYFYGCFANVKFMYKMKRARIPKRFSFMYIFTGISLTKSGRPSQICYLYEKYALIKQPIIDGLCIASLFLCKTKAQAMIPVRVSFWVGVVELVVWIGLAIYMPFYLKKERATTKRVR